VVNILLGQPPSGRLKRKKIDIEEDEQEEREGEIKRAG
jgi:hypothetical protein